MVVALVGSPPSYSYFSYRLIELKCTFADKIEDKNNIKWKALYVDMVKLFRSVLRHLSNMDKDLNNYWRRVVDAMRRDVGDTESWNKIVETSYQEIYKHLDDKIRAKIIK